MACGCPVVASACASIPEVCQDAVCYINPHDYENIAKTIARVLESLELQVQLNARAEQLLKKYCLESTVQDYFNLFSDLLSDI